MGMHPKGVAKSTSDPWGACIMTAELNCGAEGIGVGLGGVRTSETCTTSRRAKMSQTIVHVLGFMANSGTRRGFPVLLVGTSIISVKANGMGGLASPSRTSNPTQLSPRIAGIGRRLAPMEPPPHYPVAGWQAGSNRSDGVSLIPVPDWPSLISLVGSRRPLSWVSLLWRQDGLGAARERGSPPAARCPLPHHTPQYLILAFCLPR
jgi:hypothetical protein